MRLLLTRPQPDSEKLARDLTARGISSVIEPLLNIIVRGGPPLDTTGVAALAFTSANGVHAFTKRSSRRDIAVFAVGDATARAARVAAFKDVKSAMGDVADLAQLITQTLSPKAGPILHPAANQVAGDLARRLTNAGFAYRREVIYRAEKISTLSTETRTAIARGDIDGVVLMSPRTGRVFTELMIRSGLADRAAYMTVFCLSTTVAVSAGGLPWCKVKTAARPEQNAFMALLTGP